MSENPIDRASRFPCFLFLGDVDEAASELGDITDSRLLLIDVVIVGRV